MTSKLSLDALKAAYYRVYDSDLTQEKIGRLYYSCCFSVSARAAAQRGA
jgi:hypothetical protein